MGEAMNEGGSAETEMTIGAVDEEERLTGDEPAERLQDEQQAEQNEP